MNHLEGISHLNNTYIAVRHGESIANKRGIIVSTMQRGKEAYGLTKEGRRQVMESLRTAVRDGVVRYDEPIVIFSSPLLRARQTAAILQEELDAPEFHTTSALRERDFGFFDGQSDAHYQTIWDLDKESIDHTHFGVESVSHMLDRTTRFIKAIEEGKWQYLQKDAKNVILVGHGDPLNSLKKQLAGEDPAQHRSNPLRTGEIRQLQWKINDL